MWSINRSPWSSSATAAPGVTFPVMFTAPGNMRSVNNDPVFDPALVSIGPFHHGKFPTMDKHKDWLFDAMLSRLKSKDLRGILIGAMKKLEEKTRGYYFKEFDRGPYFSEMMVRDGCFILEIFRMHAELCVTYRDDPIFFARWMLPVLALDIVKLENQLPYFVLKKLHEMTKTIDQPSLDHLARRFLALLSPGLESFPMKDDHDHLLAMFHSRFELKERDHRDVDVHVHVHVDDGNSNPDHNDEDMHVPFVTKKIRPVIRSLISKLRDWNRSVVSKVQDEICIQGRNCNSFPSVTDLSLSGIKVVRKDPETTRNLLDIDYRKGRLEIPTLAVDPNTNVLMRNLVAYEQCNKTVPDTFTSYVTFIDALVNSAEDVEALRVAGVINHFMNSNEEVNKLLNSLTANIKYDVNEGYLAGLNRLVHLDHHRTWSQLKVRFWRLVASREGRVYVMTSIALYFTILQTIVAFLPYAYPKLSKEDF